jgi:protein arginine N-methyltransferase 7
MLRDQNVYDMAKTIPTLPPDMLRAACTQLKLQGNAFFKKKEYARAIEAYTGAVIGMPEEAAIYSNRSVCYMREREYEKSLADAQVCIELMPEWAKGWYRYGQTLMFMEKYEDSVAYFKKANELDPGNAEIRRCLREAEGLEYNQRATLANTMGQPIPKQAMRRPQIAEPKFDPEVLSRKVSVTDEWFTESDNCKGLTVFMQNSDIIWNLPKRLVQFLDDRVLTTAWDAAISQVLQGSWFEPPDAPVDVAAASSPMPSVLMYGSYLGFLLLSAAEKGVTEVQLVELAQVYTRKVRDVVLDNFTKEKASKMLQEIKLAIRDPLQLTTADVPGKYDVLMLALSANHDFFSSGVVEQIAKAKVDFLRPSHRIMPCRVQVFGTLIEWDENASSMGVDMSRVAAYRWNLVNDSIELGGQNFKCLSDEVLVADLNLQEAALIRPFDLRVSVPVTQTGRVQGIVTWLVIHIAEGIAVSNSPFLDPAVRSSYRMPVFQYFDPTAVEAGSSFELTVHFNLTKLWFETNPRASLIRSHMIPAWYFEMLHDGERNKRYKEAVEWVVKDWVAHNPAAKQCTVVDVGSGLGLLSVYAAKAHEKAIVYAVESQNHLAETAKHIFADNGVSKQVRLVKRDARHLTAKEIPQAADILLFEVFDAGLLGEGIIHFLEPLRNNVVAKNVRVMPLRAKIFAMVIELRTNTVGSHMFEQVNSFRYRPEYFNVDLLQLEHKILSEPFEVFEFDFQHQYRREFVKIDPQSKFFDVEITEDGVASAVAFWWELQLTEDIVLCTGPFEDYSLHWKQAVQYIPEARVRTGTKLPLVAFHNTYGLNWAIHPDRATLREGLSVIVKPPRIDPELEKMHERLGKLQEEFYKAMVNEKEFLKTRAAVSRLAIQPGMFGVNPEIINRLVRSFY